MLTIDEAWTVYGERIDALEPCTVPLRQAAGLVLAKTTSAEVPLPPFDQSAMDGFAIRSVDTIEASEQSPARLRVVGEVAAGPVDTPPALGPGQAVRIFTGAMIPPTADAVVRVERTQRGDDDASILISRPVHAGNDLRRMGEEIKAGAELAWPGSKLTPGVLGALSTAGVSEVVAYPKPRVAVIATGDEVVPPGATLRPGQVYDANVALLEAILAPLARCVTLQRCDDELGPMREAIGEAAESHDLVITTGGVSVGERDLVLEAADGAGFARVFWKVAQKPGKPLYFAMRDRVPLLGLPGNPAAVFACFHGHVLPVMRRLSGEPKPRTRFGKLTTPVPPTGSRERWLRCERRWSRDGSVGLHPLPNQASHMLGNLVRTDALAHLPIRAEPFAPGAVVSFIPC